MPPALRTGILMEDYIAKIGDNHSYVGVMPGGGSTQCLSKRIGMQKAKELILTAKRLSGSEAVDYGLALKSVPAAELEQAAETFLDQFRDKPRAAKRAMREGEGLAIDPAIELEITHFLRYTREDNTARDGFKQWLQSKSA